MTDTEASAKGVQPIEKVLLWIVLAFRVLGYLWLVLLVGAALATDDGADESIIITMVVGAGLWTVLTVVLSRTPDRIKRPWFVSSCASPWRVGASGSGIGECAWVIQPRRWSRSVSAAGVTADPFKNASTYRACQLRLTGSTGCYIAEW